MKDNDDSQPRTLAVWWCTEPFSLMQRTVRLVSRRDILSVIDFISISRLTAARSPVITWLINEGAIELWRFRRWTGDRLILSQYPGIIASVIVISLIT